MHSLSEGDALQLLVNPVLVPAQGEVVGLVSDFKMHEQWASASLCASTNVCIEPGCSEIVRTSHKAYFGGDVYACVKCMFHDKGVDTYAVSCELQSGNVVAIVVHNYGPHVINIAKYCICIDLTFRMRTGAVSALLHRKNNVYTCYDIYAIHVKCKVLARSRDVLIYPAKAYEFGANELKIIDLGIWLYKTGLDLSVRIRCCYSTLVVVNYKFEHQQRVIVTLLNGSLDGPVAIAMDEPLIILEA